jgi:endo-1,4-beta-xylanase
MSMIIKKSLQPSEYTAGKMPGVAAIRRCVLGGIFLAAITLEVRPANGASKFIGNITTRNQVRSDFIKYWDQITGENESKWETVEGTRNKFSWRGTDSIAAYARRNKIPWKFHCLVWGSQYPRWMNGLSQSEQLKEITEWLDGAAERYPDVQMIDVINEAYPSHKPPPFKNALGGDGSTGFDWMIKIFKMARERWPKALLIYNDYNTIEWNSEVNWQVKMAKAMKAANSEMDAIGVQAHDAWRVNTATVKSNLDMLAATGYPIVVSEYDIGQSNDDAQKKVMQEQFTMFWNHPKILGVTYWGYLVGATWRNGTGLLNSNGTPRPALTWLMDFVKNNPNPPCDYPDLIPQGTAVGVARRPSAPIPLTLQKSFSRENRGLVKIFNLQGKLAGVFYTADPTTGLAPTPGSYVVKAGEHFSGGYTKIQWNQP